MSSRRRRRYQGQPHQQRTKAIAVALGFVVVAAVGAGLVYDRALNSPTVAESELIEPVADADRPVAPEDQAVDLAAVRSAMFIGDSWTMGAFADPLTEGFAYRAGAQLGVPTTVLGFGGAGYITSGTNGGNYQQQFDRADLASVPAPDLIVVSGSVNDADSPIVDIESAAGAFLDSLEVRYPQAQIVLMGPDLPTLSVRDKIRNVNVAVRSTAVIHGFPYVNPLIGNWLDQNNIDTYIDRATHHPNNAGHAYIADRLVADLQSRTPAPPT